MSHSNNTDPRPHIALIPSSGMGHLNPFLRLAISLLKTGHDIQITLITAHPTISMAESNTLTQFSTSFPQVMHKQIQIPSNSNTKDCEEDPFTARYEAIRQSTHILTPLLSSLQPPLSGVVTDMSLASTTIPVTKTLNLPNYILFTTCAKMLAIYAYYHKIADNVHETKDDGIVIPGLTRPIPKSWVPPQLLSNVDNLLKTHFVENGHFFKAANGILVNTFEDLENESIVALNSGLVVDQLPPVISIGPLVPVTFETGETLGWLDDQPSGSVLYISFGTRAAISRAQMREIGIGMVKCGYKFIWVVKSKMVDRDDDEALEDILGHSLFSELEQQGFLVKTWMKQEEILSHSAIGGFLSHCGWNSVTEAIWNGVPILGWPQNADQKINAELVRTNMVGKWDESWGWGEKELVDGTEIEEKVKELMEDKMLRSNSNEMSNKAKLAIGLQGTSYKGLTQLIDSLG